MTAEHLGAWPPDKTSPSEWGRDLTREDVERLVGIAGDPVTDPESWREDYWSATAEQRKWMCSGIQSGKQRASAAEFLGICLDEAEKMEQEDEIDWPKELVEAYHSLISIYFGLERETKPSD